MNVLFIVTARGGSVGVPKKNIKKIGKYPLIAYKIIAAQKCKFDKRIIVSTDSEEIAQIAKKYGAEVPFMRPKDLATSTASSIDVVLHAMKWIDKNDTKKYDYICLLEPSSPFLYYDDINKAFDIIISKQANILLGVKEVEVCRDFIFPLDDNGRMSYHYDAIKKMTSVRRQDQPKEYTPNGCIYISKWDYMIENKMFYSSDALPYFMPEEQSVEIDTPFDLFLAEMIAKNKMIDFSKWD